MTKINHLKENYRDNVQEINTKKGNHKLLESIIRSRVRWINDCEEQPTNYFHHLENQHFINKSIPNLINADNSNETTDQKDIFLELENNYRIYTNVKMVIVS